MTQVSTIAPRYMRDVLGNFCSGLTVLTAMAGDQPVGFTCQSFSSLSLDPPLVSVSPARSSTTWPKIRAAGVFAVNVLSSEQVAISDRFARPVADKFDGVGWEPGPLGAPLLHGVLAWAECRVWAEYDGGDHTIVAAEVVNLGASPSAGPLVFYQGEYHVLNSQRHWRRHLADAESS